MFLLLISGVNDTGQPAAGNPTYTPHGDNDPEGALARYYTAKGKFGSANNRLIAEVESGDAPGALDAAGDARDAAAVAYDAAGDALASIPDDGDPTSPGAVHTFQTIFPLNPEAAGEVDYVY